MEDVYSRKQDYKLSDRYMTLTEKKEKKRRKRDYVIRYSCTNHNQKYKGSKKKEKKKKGM